MLISHGIGGREDLPLPLEWAVAGAAAAVVVSFVALGALWREPRLDDPLAGRPLPAGLARLLDAPAFRTALRVLGLVAAAWTLLALVFGPDDTRNAVPWVVYVLMWVGLVPLSVLLGPVWRAVNPVRTLHALVNRALGLDPREGLRPLPAGLGWWPGAVGLAAFAWLELVSPDPASQSTLRWAVALYVSVHLFAGLVFGSGWFDRADTFEVWSGLFGRIAPLGRRADGVLVLRAPLRGLGLTRGEPGLTPAIVVMLAATVYDGLSGSTTWKGWAQAQDAPQEVIGTLGLLGTILALGLLFELCTRAAALLGRDQNGSGATGSGGSRAALAEVAGSFAPSVVPVAFGYVVAHYYSFFVLEGQRAFVRLTDPLGIGANWLGTAGLTPNAALVRPTLVANIMVLAIVVGHVLGVVVAHDRAVGTFPRRAAVVGQLPLLVLMVSLTCLGLFLLFWS